MVLFFELILVVTFFSIHTLCENKDIQIQKCCPFGQSINNETFACEGTDNPFSLKFNNGSVIDRANIIVNKIEKGVVTPNEWNVLEISTNGKLMEIYSNGDIEHFDEFCVDFEGSQGKLIAFLSRFEEIRKCCPETQNFNSNMECQNATSLNIFHYSNSTTEVEMIENDLIMNDFTFYSESDYFLEIFDDGNLKKIPKRSPEKIETLYKNFCVEHFDKTGMMVVKVAIILQVKIFWALRTISIFCFIVTAIIYMAIPKLNDFTGKSLALHCISISVAHSLRLIENKNILWPNNYVTEYFLLLAYAWLIVMWVNISLVINKNIKGLRRLKDKPDIGKFLLAGLFAFGIPLLLVMLTNYFSKAVCFKVFHCKCFLSI